MRPVKGPLRRRLGKLIDEAPPDVRTKLSQALVMFQSGRWDLVATYLHHLASEMPGALYDRVDNLATDLEAELRGVEWTRLMEPA